VNIVEVPSPAGAEDATAYIERLGQLRIWAGRPSLRRLAELAGTTISPSGYVVNRLPPSTTSDVLSGKRLPHLPRLDLVEAFVAACMQARHAPQDVVEGVVEQWLADWRRLAALTPPRDEGRDGRLDESNATGVTADGGVRTPGDRPLVGRGSALRSIEEAFNEIAHGRHQFVAVVGEPGVGKTRLLSELAAIAARRNLVVLRGRAGEYEQELPLGAVVDALDDLLEGRQAWVLDRLGMTSAQMLGTVFPALEALSDGAFTGPDLGGLVRMRVYRAIRRLLEELAAPSGLVLILDDVHWADKDLVELLYRLLRHPPRGRILIAVAYRPAQVAPQLAGLLESELDQARLIPAEPLTPTGAQEFLGPQVDREYVRMLFEASGGNPFYLEALARMNRATAWTSEGSPDPSGIPHSVTVALQVELNGLSATASLVGRAAAVIANEFEAPVVAIAAQMDEDVVLAALDEMNARDIIRPVDSGGRFQFRHPLLRTVAYGQAAPGWRFAAHARIAAHLADLGAHVTVRAHHVERSGRFGDEAAIATLVEAARTVAQQAPASAAHWLQKALLLMAPSDTDPDLRLNLLLELAQLHLLSGRLAEGLDVAREALRLLPTGDQARRAQAARISAMIERLLGRPDESRFLLLDALRQMQNLQSAASVALQLRLMADNLYRSDFRAAQAIFDSLPEAGEDWEPILRIAVAAMRPMPAFAAGRVADAARHLTYADRLITAVPDESLGEWLDPINWLIWTELFMGRYENALRHSERVLSIARSTGHTAVAIMTLTAKGRANAMLGRLTEGAIMIEKATRIAREIESPQLRAITMSQECLIASWAGDDRKALRCGEQAVREAKACEEWWASQARYARALALINAGELDQGTDAATRAFEDAKLDQPSVLSCCELMAHAEAARDRPAHANLWADRADHIAHHTLDMNLGFSYLARAHGLRTIAPVTAAERARLAAQTFATTDQRVDGGRARLCAGVAYAKVNEVGRAREQLEQAVEIFANCGARGLHAEALRKLGGIG
jgi:tetratricopeptide (TPR) repeat protein